MSAFCMWTLIMSFENYFNLLLNICCFRRLYARLQRIACQRFLRARRENAWGHARKRGGKSLPNYPSHFYHFTPSSTPLSYERGRTSSTHGSNAYVNDKARNKWETARKGSCSNLVFRWPLLKSNFLYSSGGIPTIELLGLSIGSSCYKLR